VPPRGVVDGLGAIAPPESPLGGGVSPATPWETVAGGEAVSRAGGVVAVPTAAASLSSAMEFIMVFEISRKRSSSSGGFGGGRKRVRDHTLVLRSGKGCVSRSKSATSTRF
jgi:hypothetical protein